MNQRNKFLLLSVISFYGFSEAQQSQFFADKELYRYNLAENLYQNKIYAASQYEFSRQFFYNQNLDNSKKETALFLLFHSCNQPKIPPLFHPLVPHQNTNRKNPVYSMRLLESHGNHILADMHLSSACGNDCISG